MATDDDALRDARHGDDALSLRGTVRWALNDDGGDTRPRQISQTEADRLAAAIVALVESTDRRPRPRTPLRDKYTQTVLAPRHTSP